MIPDTRAVRAGLAVACLSILGWVCNAPCAADVQNDQNLIVNGSAETLDGKGQPAGWSVYVRKGVATLSQTTRDKTEGAAAARIELGEQGANFDVRTGHAKVQPRPIEATYLFTADVKTEFHKAGILAGYFCIAAGDKLHVGNFTHNAGWQTVRVEVVVPAKATITRLEFSGGRAGPAVILIDNVRLQFLHENQPAAGAQTDQAAAPPPSRVEPGIRIAPGNPVRITKVMPLDSRLVRAFAFGPFDGRIDTRYATGSISEWGGEYGVAAVSYRAFNGNNGLHVTLPAGGVDALLLRGNWEGRLYADVDGLLDPGTAAVPLCEVRPVESIYRRQFPRRLEAQRLSFFYDNSNNRKTLNDVTFLRLSTDQTSSARESDLILHAGAIAEPDAIMASAVQARFGSSDRIHNLVQSSGGPITLEANAYAHLITPPQDPALGISAVTVTFDVAQAGDESELALRVHDVLDARRESMAADVTLAGPGRYTVTLDHPDQVFLPPPAQWLTPSRLEQPLAPPPVVWLSLASSTPVQLRGVTVTLHRVQRQAALAEAGAWRRFLLKGLFQSMSEPRPWMHLTDAGPIREQIASSKPIATYQSSLIELLENAEIARLLSPEDDVVRQYHDWLYQNVDRRKPHPPAVWPDVPGAPQWAVGVREGWRQVSDIARWWLDHRLVANGELGGGIGDDTDLFQTWQCLPLIESAPLGARLKEASARLTDAAIEHKLEEGINKNSMDALHAYEEGVNQLAMNAWWFYGDPVHFERVMASARSVLKLMIETKDGRVHFGGNYMSIREARHGFETVGKSPGDGTWAPARLMLHPLYVVGLYNRNPAVVDKFERWGRTWRNYQKRDAYVGQVDIQSGAPTVVSPMPSAAGVGPVDEWLALYHMTGDPKWQEPFIFMMDSGGYKGTTVQYGRMPHAMVDWPSPYQEQMRSWITGAGSGYAGFFLHKDRDLLNQWLETSASWFGRFQHMHTAAEQKTDRVLTYNATVPIACYLGDAPNRNRWLNFSAVSYENLRGEDFAALVWDAGDDRLKVAIYNFTDGPLNGVMRTWRLAHGRYRLRIGADGNDDGELDGAAITTEIALHRFSPIEISLPPKQITIVQADQLQRLDDLTQRADLAVSSLDTRMDGQSVLRVVVHNIGARAAVDVRVDLVRDGKTIASTTIPQIDAPNDLIPRVAEVLFKQARAGDAVRIDPDDAIAEIAEHNNHLRL